MAWMLYPSVNHIFIHLMLSRPPKEEEDPRVSSWSRLTSFVSSFFFQALGIWFNLCNTYDPKNLPTNNIRYHLPKPDMGRKERGKGGVTAVHSLVHTAVS